jgi:hypothetical protein
VLLLFFIKKYVIINYKIKEKKEKRRMITAKEAKKQTDEVRRKQIDRAKELAKSEFESFIEPKIKEAIACGDYSISFAWEASKFKEVSVDDAIIELLNDLEYEAKIDSVVSGGYVIKAIIFIKWGK